MADTTLMAIAFVVAVPLAMALLAWASERPVRREARAARRDSAATAAFLAGALWLLLTVVGEALALSVDVYPSVISDKGDHIAEAFRALTVMAVPVFAFVVAALAYMVLRRGYDSLPSDGPAMSGEGAPPLIWLAVTGGLTALIMVYPGLTSLHAVMSEEEPDLVVRVEGMQWIWLVSYPELGVKDQRELVLPVDRTVKFEITSRDVLHSFWVPAFLMKVDAVPGMTTTITLRPTREASFDTDQTVRLQCAELCGLSHANMRISVSVVSESDFETWVKGKRAP